MKEKKASPLREVADSDSAIRAVLKARLLRKPDRHGTVIVEELGLSRGQVRVDVAVVNGSLHGYEIKSDRDSLKRLSTQVGLYSKVLDFATLVVGDRFVTAAANSVPEWWGIIHAKQTRNGPTLRHVRRPRANPSKDARTLVELLWAEEALAFLDAHGDARGFRGKPRRVLWDRLCERFTVDELADVVRERLKARAHPDRP